MSSSDPLENLERVNFKAGDLILREGDESYFFYIVQEGQVEVFKTYPSGERRTLGFVEPGQPLGEFALVTHSPRSASARAITNGYAVKVSADGYQELLNGLPEWAVAVLSSLIQRLKVLNAAMETGAEGENTVVDLENSHMIRRPS